MTSYNILAKIPTNHQLRHISKTKRQIIAKVVRKGIVIWNTKQKKFWKSVNKWHHSGIKCGQNVRKIRENSLHLKI